MCVTQPFAAHRRIAGKGYSDVKAGMSSSDHCSRMRLRAREPWPKWICLRSALTDHWRRRASVEEALVAHHRVPDACRVFARDGSWRAVPGDIGQSNVSMLTPGIMGVRQNSWTIRR
jgi:hypothetical protein